MVVAALMLVLGMAVVVRTTAMTAERATATERRWRWEGECGNESASAQWKCERASSVRISMARNVLSECVSGRVLSVRVSAVLIHALSAQVCTRSEVESWCQGTCRQRDRTKFLADETHHMRLMKAGGWWLGVALVGRPAGLHEGTTGLPRMLAARARAKSYRCFAIVSSLLTSFVCPC